MAKITILSPVHIGTGNTIETPSYKLNFNNTISRFEFESLLVQIPSQLLLDKKLLNEINYNSKNKKQSKLLYQFISKYSKYEGLNPRYTLKYNLEYDIKDYPYDVLEQVKSLDKPIIPGSSIKGALLNSWIYDLLHQYKISENVIEKYLIDVTKNKDYSIMSLLISENSGIKAEKFLKDISSCIICHDLTFNDMELYDANRIGCGQNGTGELPLPYMECIRSNQMRQQPFFNIDKDKLKTLKEEKYNKFPKLLEILDRVKKSSILHATNKYMKDMLEVEMSEELQLLYSDYQSINSQLISIHRLMEDFQKKHLPIFFMRIGNSTNYNFKTISLFVKNTYPNLYKKYFNRVFSPINPNGKIKVNREKMPKTRTVLSNSEGYILSGFIMVSYDKEN